MYFYLDLSHPRPRTVWTLFGPEQRGKMTTEKVWERGVFGSAGGVCSVNPEACVPLLREMPTLLGPETVVTGRSGAQPGRSGQTTR